MERRREPRVRVDGPARVTVLSKDRSVALDARIIDLSGRGLSISLPGPMPIGAPVKIERQGEMWLGEVVYVRSSGGGFQIGIEIEQAFQDREDLERLRKAVSDVEPSPAFVDKA